MHAMTSPNTTPHRFGHRIAMVGVSILAAAVLAACSGGHAEEAGAAAAAGQRRAGAGQAGQPVGRVQRPRRSGTER
jgi:hypothetical protein